MKARAMKNLFLSAVIAVTAAACGPDPGDIVYDLQTPNTNDGALHFVYRAPVGDEIGLMTAECSGCRIFTHRVSAQEVRGILVGTNALPSASVLRVGVGDIRDPSVYTVQLKQVAAADNSLRSSINGYRLVPVP